MIQKKRFLLAAATILATATLITSCEDQTGEQAAGTSVPATFTPGITGTTRVINDTWTGDEVVGIHTLAATATSLPDGAAFNTYKPNTDKTSLLPTATDQTIYYPIDGSDVHFYAFSPAEGYTANTDNHVTYTGSDQGDRTKIEAVDFIWAAAEGTHNKKNPDVTLNFAHKQSKVMVSVTAATEGDAVDMSNPALTLKNIPNKATYSLKDGTVVSGTIAKGTIAPYISSTNTPLTKVVWEAIVPPHNGSDYNGRELSFSLGGKTYNFPIPDTHNYTAGSVYKYDLTLKTNGLSLTASNVVDWQGGTISWNGEYYLNLSASEAELHRDEITEHKLTIKTNYLTEAPTAHRSKSSTTLVDEDVDWLTVSEPQGSDGAYTLTYTATVNDSGSEREAYIHVKVGGLLTAVVKVTQSNVEKPVDGLTNCYLVPLSNSVLIPIGRAYTAGDMPDNTTNLTASILWADTDCIEDPEVRGSGTSANILVKTKAALGNAVIALHGGDSQEIYWSWHIWVTDYNPNIAGTFTTTNSAGHTFEFMDRNLGASENSATPANWGLFYQWGRKDPFPNAKEPGDPQAIGTFTSIMTNDELGTIIGSIRNPNVFIGSYNNWLKVRNSTLWGECSTKTLYDPCPAGWRVPPYYSGGSMVTDNIETIAIDHTAQIAQAPAGIHWKWGGARDATAGHWRLYESKYLIWSTTTRWDSDPKLPFVWEPAFSAGSKWTGNPNRTSVESTAYCVRCVKDINP